MTAMAVLRGHDWMKASATFLASSKLRTPSEVMVMVRAVDHYRDVARAGTRRAGVTDDAFDEDAGDGEGTQRAGRDPEALAQARLRPDRGGSRETDDCEEAGDADGDPQKGAARAHERAREGKGGEGDDEAARRKEEDLLDKHAPAALGKARLQKHHGAPFAAILLAPVEEVEHERNRDPQQTHQHPGIQKKHKRLRWFVSKMCATWELSVGPLDYGIIEAP